MCQVCVGGVCKFMNNEFMNKFISSGAHAETSGKVNRGNEGYETEGVRGLKTLGVRDLTYRLAFLACTVTPSNSKVGLCIIVLCIRDHFGT